MNRRWCIRSNLSGAGKIAGRKVPSEKQFPNGRILNDLEGIIPVRSANMTNDEWLTIEQASRLSGYHTEYLRIIVRAGKLVAHKFGSVWAINKRSLLAYLKAAEKSGDKRYGPKIVRK